MDPHKPSYELRVRNVSLHRRGKQENGTLYVTRHHLIFSYQPFLQVPSILRLFASSPLPKSLIPTYIMASNVQVTQMNGSVSGDRAKASQQDKGTNADTGASATVTITFREILDGK